MNSALLKTQFLLLLIGAAAALAAGFNDAGTTAAKSSARDFQFFVADSTAFEELGEALFSDNRFSSPDGKSSGLPKDEYSQFRLSCKSCHMVDEELSSLGMRGYTDFAGRSPVPYRKGDADPHPRTHRRTQQMINIAGENISSAPSYHWDGEFSAGNEHSSLLKLIDATFVSRNMGWRKGEEQKANSLRLKYILEEAPSSSAAGSEKEDPSYIERYCLSFGLSRDEFFRLSGGEILTMGTEAIAYYIEKINSDIESPFDLFLQENGVPNPKTADEDIIRKLLKSKDLKFINKTIPVVNSEIITSRKVRFGKTELAGLRLFMNANRTNCSGCHTPPSFTDNRFHNIGVSETDYFDVHRKFPGDVLDMKKIQKEIETLGLDSLKMLYQVYPSAKSPQSMDLGRMLFSKSSRDIASFRTPGLRNLKYCNPYTHSGRAETITEAIMQHIMVSGKKDIFQFTSAELPEISLSTEEIKALEAFLNSLNDHYE